MADTPKKPGHYAEIIAGLVSVVALIAVALYYVIFKVAPGMAPVAAQGAAAVKISDVLFYVLASISVVSAAGVAFARNIIYSALALLGTLLGSGALYIFLNADYVAITQLLVYVGGVLVLILFAVMLTSRIGEKKHSNPSSFVLPGLALLGGMLLLFGFVATRAPWKVAAQARSSGPTTEAIGDLFLGHYLLPFEVASLVLLATLVGAVVVARKEMKEG